MFKASSLLRYYGWRIIKFVPLLATVLIFGMFIVPMIGHGPIWSTYETVMQPCGSYWWTVLLQINNFYPYNFDEKCMPWAWFIPALTQVSLVLPILAYIYKKATPHFTIIRIITILIVVGLATMNGLLVGYADVGAMPVRITPITTA